MARHFGTRYASDARNRERALIAGAIAVVLALSGGAVLLLSTTRDQIDPAAISPQDSSLDPMISVLVPVRDIEEGQSLTPALFREELRPVKFLRVGTIRSVEEIKNRYALSTLLEGEPLVTKRITTTRRFSPISPQITKDKSAVTIRVDDLNSASGMLRPGELVDVAWIHKINGKPAIQLIVRSAPVLAADQQVEGEFRPGTPVPGTITLLVAPADAMQIQLAARSGTLSLALRGPDPYYAPDADKPITEDTIARTAPVQTASAVECRGKVKMNGESFCLTADGNIVLRE